MISKNALSGFVFICVAGFSALFHGQNAIAQTYEPPTGEQPTYGKKFRPSEVNSSIILELNPLLLLTKSIGLETEFRISELASLGADLLYQDNEVFSRSSSGSFNGVPFSSTLKAKVNYIGVAPKVRLYPLSTMSGLFFGGKIALGMVTKEIDDTKTKKEFSKFVISPTVHAGYRLSAFNGFTLAAYLGGGLNLPNPKLESSDLDASVRDNTDWNSAKDDVNSAVGIFRPDFGLTLGIAL